MKNTLFSNQKKYDKYIKIALIIGWAICFIILAEALNIYLFFIGKSNQMKIFISITFFTFAIVIIILLFIYNFNSKKIRLEKKNLLANAAVINLNESDIINKFSHFGTIKNITEDMFYLTYKVFSLRRRYIFVKQNNLTKEMINSQCLKNVNMLENDEMKVNFWSNKLSVVIIFLTNKMTPDLGKKLKTNNDNLLRRVESITYSAICFEEKKFYIQPHLGLESHAKYTKNLKMLSDILELE